ncbi:MAG: exonuclease III [Methanoregula sp. PtaU1.Bin051]|nr:MAG: exonuclease III [Methanoregula sp. PtaU1.Bin051]
MVINMKKIATNLTLDSFSSNEDIPESIGEENNKIQTILSSICWNIGNPSIDRAKKQALWLKAQNFDLLFLTECKKSEGCIFLERYFQNFGYHVIFPKPDNNEYGVMIISKIKPEPSNFSKLMTELGDRLISIKVPLAEKFIEIIVTYVPSRNATEDRKARKKHFLENLLLCFKQDPISHNRIFCGDFNILEPDHDPHYSFFENWEYNFYSDLLKFNMLDIYRYFSPTTKEYSWIGRTNDGYRYDHFFASIDLLPQIIECKYLHEPREMKLSDHSALVCKINKIWAL